MKTYNGLTAQEFAAEVNNAISGIRLIDDRISILRDLEFVGHFEEKPMGSGGVGQYKEMKDGTLRVQIGYGHGKSNYAMCLVVQAD